MSRPNKSTFCCLLLRFRIQNRTSSLTLFVRCQPQVEDPNFRGSNKRVTVRRDKKPLTQIRNAFNGFLNEQRIPLDSQFFLYGKIVSPNGLEEDDVEINDVDDLDSLYPYLHEHFTGVTNIHHIRRTQIQLFCLWLNTACA